jgi:RimJ/RimL family protein N-acetyltransferase
VVGYCGYYHHELDGVPEVEIGYRLHPDYWGRGLATESASLVRDFGFSTLGFPRLISIIDPGNVRSIRVAERIGMTFLRYHLFRGEVPTSLYGMAAPGLKLS